MIHKKIYVGKIAGSETRVMFRCSFTPTEETHNLYGWVLGPFKTVRAAKYCVAFPHAQCANVKEFERAAAIAQCQAELIKDHLEYLNKEIFYSTKLDKTIGQTYSIGVEMKSDKLKIMEAISLLNEVRNLDPNVINLLDQKLNDIDSDNALTICSYAVLEFECPHCKNVHKFAQLHSGYNWSCHMCYFSYRVVSINENSAKVIPTGRNS